MSAAFATASALLPGSCMAGRGPERPAALARTYGEMPRELIAPFVRPMVASSSPR